MKKRSSKKQIALYGAIAVALLIAGCVSYMLFKPKPAFRKPITYPGPTAQDITDAENNKQAVENLKKIESEAANNPTPDKKQVEPQIASATQANQEVIVRTYIGGVFEDGGTCTATFTQNALSFSEKSVAFADATTTTCAPIHVNRSDFGSAGTWSVSVKYDSETAQGVSQAKTFGIQ